MNYYYDVILNWSEEAGYEFYEWNDTDALELIKKIPLFKVKHKVLVDMLEYNIKVNKEFLDLIQDKTLISGKKMLNKIPNAALFSDGKNALAIEFNSEGLSISESKLLIDDELNVLEVVYNLKEVNFNYEVLDNRNKRMILRQEGDAKKLIALEINNLYQNQDLAKLKYLYYEYKKETVNDIKFIYDDILNDLEGNFDQNILRLYYIIKMSYNNV